MITIFSIPREFQQLFNIIQTNAIKSWQELGAEVVLFGDDSSIIDAAHKLDVKLLRQIKKNKYGTPLISDALNQIKKIATTDIIAYVNCDIILLADFITTLKAVSFKQFLLVGQRRPLKITNQLVGQKNWQRKLLKRIADEKVLPKAGSSDYFVYPKNISFPMPPFAVGKLYWDKWLFFSAKQKSIPIIDATLSITAIHQQHYFKKTDHGYGEKYLGKEAIFNKNLMPAYTAGMTIIDADYYIVNTQLKKPILTPFKIIRQMEIALILAAQKYPMLMVLVWLVEMLRKIVTIFLSNVR